MWEYALGSLEKSWKEIQSQGYGCVIFQEQEVMSGGQNTNPPSSTLTTPLDYLLNRL